MHNVKKKQHEKSDKSETRAKKGIPEFLDSGHKSWTLDSGCSTLDAGLWTLDSGRWSLDAEPWTLEAGLWTLGNGLWTLDARLWVLKLWDSKLFKALETMELYQYIHS